MPHPRYTPKTVRLLWGGFLLWLFFCNTALGGTGTPQNVFKGEGPWFEQTESGGPRLYLYFFWSNKCPHCRRAKPFLEKLQKETPWILLKELEVTDNPDNARRFESMVHSIGQQSRAVPALMFCGGMVQGFDREENSGVQLKELLTTCRADLTAYLAPPSALPATPPQEVSAPPAISPLALALGLLGVLSAGGAVFFRMKRLKK